MSKPCHKAHCAGYGHFEGDECTGSEEDMHHCVHCGELVWEDKGLHCNACGDYWCQIGWQTTFLSLEECEQLANLPGDDPMFDCESICTKCFLANPHIWCKDKGCECNLKEPKVVRKRYEEFIAHGSLCGSIELEKQDQAWRVELYRYPKEEKARLCMVWGKKGGKMQTKVSVFTEGKQGRDAVGQAVLEATQSAKLKVRTKGYTLVPGPYGSSGAYGYLQNFQEQQPTMTTKKRKKTQEPEPKTPKKKQQVDQKTVVPFAMLAAKWEDQEKKYEDDFDLYVQPKLDGLRALGNVATGQLWSRQRKPLDRLPWIEDQVREFGRLAQALEIEFTWLDGELYCHGQHFDQVSHLVRGQDPEHQVQYHVYDAVLNVGFEQRIELLKRVFDMKKMSSKQRRFPNIVLVRTEMAFKSEVDAYLQEFLDAKPKYEGAIVRIPEFVYEGKRSRSLCKYKQFEQEEFVIIGVESQTRNINKLGAFVLDLGNGSGKTFKASCSGISAEGQQLFWEQRESLVGQIATIKFFEANPKTGIPRFPKALGVRHPDDM